jgi:hypothetical protein
VSLNNRISIRDAYNARGGDAGCPAVTTPRGASGVATDTMIPEAESQSHLPGMTQPVAEAEVEERVE